MNKDFETVPAVGASVPTSVDEIQLALNRKARRKDIFSKVLPIVGFAIVLLFFMVSTGGSLVASSNLMNLVEQCFTVAIMSVGMSFIFACGSMDISLGANMALAQLVMGRMMLMGGFPTIVIFLMGIAITIGCELVVGAISTYLNVPAFVASLCMMNICSGIVANAVSNNDLYIPYTQYSHFNSGLLKLLVLVITILVGLLIFNKTRLGRDLKALGGNSVAAQQSGIRKGKTVLLAFVILGVCVGIAGFFSLTNTGMVTASSGSGLGLNIMVAVVLGGFPMTGGSKARLWAAVIGALTVTVLTNGLALMGVDSNLSLFVKGLLYLLIVGISYERVRGKEIS